VIRADAGCVRHAPADGASSLISARELKRCSAERRVQRLIGRRVNERACVTRSESREREREREIERETGARRHFVVPRCRRLAAKTAEQRRERSKKGKEQKRTEAMS